METLPNLDYAKLAEEFSAEEQNAAAWLAVVLLIAENRAFFGALRNLLIEKELVTAAEIDTAVGVEIQQPKLGNWYGYVNQLYAYRVAETLDLQRKKKSGELNEEDAPKGDVTEVAGDSPIPSGPPPKEEIIAATTIIQTAPTEEELNGPEK